VKRLLLGLALLAAVAAAGVSIWLSLRPALPPPPSAEELARLDARRVALQNEVDALIRQDDQGLGRAPEAGILVGMPTRLTQRVLGQVVTGLFGETTLTLKNLKASVSKDVRAKLLIRKRTIGHIDLSVDIHEVQGVLEPGEPTLTFGGNRVGIRLPVRVARGSGRATLHARWDSKGLANAVCGDVEVHPEVSGSVVPTDYLVEGAFHFAVRDGRIVLTPDFGELAVRLFVKASEESWQVVDKVVEERNAVCRTALNKVDLREQLEKVLGKGFSVKIPPKIFKPLSLPAGIEKSLEMQGVKLTLAVVPTNLVITPDRLWYGADVRAKGAKAPAPGLASPPPPPPPPPAAGVSSAGIAPASQE